MNTEVKKDEVVIKFSTVEDVFNILNMGEINPFSQEARLRDKLREQFAQMIADKKRLLSESKRLEFWDIVEPKPGHNTLRAGNTAYGRAVVVKVEPLMLESEDGKHHWSEHLEHQNFTVVGKKIAELCGD